MTRRTLSDLLAAARRARTAYEWEEAIACYAEALALIAAIEQALDDFVGNAPPVDDVTLLVTKMED